MRQFAYCMLQRHARAIIVLTDIMQNAYPLSAY